MSGLISRIPAITNGKVWLKASSARANCSIRSPLHEGKDEEEMRHELVIDLQLFMRASSDEGDEVEFHAESDDEGKACHYTTSQCPA